MRAWIARRRRELALMILATILGAIATEALYRRLLRARYLRAFAAQRTHLVLLPRPRDFALPPSVVSAAWVADHSRQFSFRTNSDGFRGGDAGPKRKRRVMLLGDSFVFGYGVLEQDTLQAQLQARRPELQVVNAGVPGYDSEQEAATLDEYLPRYQPDVVVLVFVMNDADPQNAVLAPPDELYRYSVSWLLADLKGLLRLDSGKNEAAFDYASSFRASSPKRRTTERALAAIAERCRGAGVPLVIAIFPDVMQPLDRSYPNAWIHALVAGWGRALGVETIDLLPFFKGEPSEKFMVVGDGHPNAEAFARATAALLPPIDRALAAGGDRSR